jgi:hypothetical protein
MLKRNCLIGLTIVLLLPIISTALAQEKKMTPEELIAAHVNSIGSPEALKGLQSRVLIGNAMVKFVQGWSGAWNDGTFLMASEPNKVGLVMQFGALEYPGERFGFDGKDVVVGNIKPGQRSPVADFIYRFNSFVKEGLLGGTLSLAWPLLHFKEKQAELKVSEGKLDGRPVYELEYRKKALGEMRVKLIFDAANFHHLRSEYRITHKSDMTSTSNPVSSAPARSYDRDAGEIAPNTTIMEGVADSNYQLVEKFENYQAAGGLTLPYTYSLEYEVQGQGSSFVGNWGMRASGKFINNGQIDPSFFKAISIK